MASSSFVIISVHQILCLLLFFTCSSRSNPITNDVAQSRSKILNGRTLPLVNQTILGVLTTPLGDFFRPGQYNLQQSTLPLYVVLFNVIGNVIAFVIFLYIWKEVYYQVPDPYATADGPAPPQLKTEEMESLTDKILQSLSTFERLFL